VSFHLLELALKSLFGAFEFLLNALDLPHAGSDFRNPLFQVNNRGCVGWERGFELGNDVHGFGIFALDFHHSLFHRLNKIFTTFLKRVFNLEKLKLPLCIA
jgi:hypothetical protein